MLVCLSFFFACAGFAANAPQKPAVQDYFQSSPMNRWVSVSGQWKVEDAGVEVYDVDKRDIYISPEEPSHLAWASLWKELDGSIKTCFAQITGNPGLAPSYAPWYGNGRSREQWLAFAKEHKLQPGPDDAVSTTKVEFPTLMTRDGGKTWKNLGMNQKPQGANMRFAVAANGEYVNHGICTIRCKDGRLVSTIWPEEWRKDGKYIWDQYLLAVRESLDNGKTWSKDQFIRPEGSDPKLIASTSEENGMVELPDGRTLCVIVSDPGSPVQTYLSRVGPGNYTATPPTLLPFGNTGLPELARCDDGVIWYYGIDGHWYTVDEGKSWNRLPQRFASYYGKMVSAGPNRILSVSQKNGGDSPYPHYRNATIGQEAFSYRRIGVMKQTDAAASLALVRLKQGTYGDMHIRADVKTDNACGVAFHVSPDGRHYYVFALVMPGTGTYTRWFPPQAQEESLSRAYPNEWLQFATGNATMVVLARVDDGVVTVLRGTSSGGKLATGLWMQVQVKVKGDLIQAAYKQPEDGAYWEYIGARDSKLKSGGVGLVTDESLGEFKDLQIWSTPQMIRDMP